MGTIVGYTAQRMLEIENGTVVDGSVDGSGHLILVKKDTTTIDAGSVIGPQGIQGPTGATSISVCTSATRPTGGARFTGLYIYETDTKMVYVWDGANWIYKGGIFVCTTATLPASPPVGLPIWLTDQKRFLIFNGVRNDPPWNMPWGLVGPVFYDLVGQSGLTTSVTDLGSITFTAVKNRFYEIKASAVCGSTVSGVLELDIWDSIAAQLILSRGRGETTPEDTVTAEFTKSYTSNGDVTVKVRGRQSAGSGTGSLSRVYLSVKDVGPNGAPLA